jgi:hypothetical protein
LLCSVKVCQLEVNTLTLVESKSAIGIGTARFPCVMVVRRK